MADKIFAEGLHYDTPAENAPEWLKAKLSFRVRDFIPFLETYKNDRGFVTIDIKLSQGGKYYCELNQWRKPDEPKEASLNEIYPDDISPYDIPF